MNSILIQQDGELEFVGQRPEEAPAEQVAAWEMIENGRYMPRRICGSFPGRELG